MSTVVPLVARRRPRAVVPAKLALLGTGTVGSAFVARYEDLAARKLRLPRFAWLANSRVAHEGDSPSDALREANAAPRERQQLQSWAETEGLREGDLLVDATASDAVANWHAEWLARGVHVVTANKLGHGALLARSHAILDAQGQGGAQYGDHATVGAGLPLLSSLRALIAGGDRIHSVEGVLSGSLAWLFNSYDGERPFSALVRDAVRAGYTEPDPRLDLSGEDVRRKLLILARSAGRPLESDSVVVDSLVPQALAALAPGAALEGLEALDDLVHARYAEARREGAQLRFVGRFDASGASVGLRALPPAHPLCGGTGTDNRVAVHSDRYPLQPLLIQGPGAGATVTAAALLDDVLRIAAH